ncbi:TetR/AcrR family transcriptional regulator [Metabacillus indicus]|uniref:TetR/AcrR family transcriptional regulator n=1 Tax=Metabacillus indicus TaxID=246786 RepID=UPI003CF33F53
MSNKKEEIITSSAKLIHSKGYENTKLSDILKVADIGKGQFYHYFSSKRDLGLAVIDNIVNTWNQELIVGIFYSNKTASEKLNSMLEWAINYHNNLSSYHGCPFGNLALEMSEHDEEFRLKINALFSSWLSNLEEVMSELDSEGNARLKSQAIIAQIEGSIILMKNFNDITYLKDSINYIRNQYL